MMGNFPCVFYMLQVTWITFLNARITSGNRHIDNGKCNATFSGAEYVDGYFGSHHLRSISIDHTLVGKPLYCKYTFQGVDNQRVYFRIKRLHVGIYNIETRECERGYLKIWDGIASPGRYMYPPNTLCGDYAIGGINSHKFTSGAFGELEFYSEYVTPHITFTAAYKYVNVDLEKESFAHQITHDMHLKTESGSVCNWEILLESSDNREYVFVSPGYPGIYPPNTECFYHITSDDTFSAVQLTFNGEHRKPRHFDLRISTDCSDNYLAVYDGPDVSSPLIGRFCGTEMQDIMGTSRNMLLVFASGPDAPPFDSIGFHATASAVTKEWHNGAVKTNNSLCDWNLNTTEGSISTPEHWLPRNTHCSYVFHVKPEYVLDIILHFYGLRDSCQDRVEIDDNGEIKRICNNNVQERLEREERFNYTLRGPVVRVHYDITDGQMHSTPHRGFWLSFSQKLGPPVMTTNDDGISQGELKSESEDVYSILQTRDNDSSRAPFLYSYYMVLCALQLFCYTMLWKL